MDLFENDFENATRQDETRKSKKKSTPLNSFKMRLALYKEFTTAVQKRDKRLLNFLLSDKQESKHWATKQDFIEKYLTACEYLESMQSIKITTQKGIGLLVDVPGWQDGICVTVDSIKGNNRLWKFNVVFLLDEASKIKIYKSKRFLTMSAINQNVTIELFGEIPHPSCSPPKPIFPS